MDFNLPFSDHIDDNNRWVQLSKKIPWTELEEDYSKKIAGNDRWASAKSFRLALGSLIIKEKMKISDQEVVEQIRETPCLQYFIGLPDYKDEVPFDPSMMIHFRRCLNGALIHKANELLFQFFRED
ncbi:MAG: transposase [Okeania sp. SIO3B3]|nr:transposase [Okeania sp. SIO3B3]